MMLNQSTPLKDKWKPKNPMSAYAYFFVEVREEHKRRYPSEPVRFAELSKVCAERWKTIDEKVKDHFKKKADADKQRYNKEISEYNPPDGVPVPKRRRTPKDPLKPKRALSAFFHFCVEVRPEVREEHPDWNVTTVAKELGKMWELCENKNKYEIMSQKDKERYEEEMVKFNNGLFVRKE